MKIQLPPKLRLFLPIFIGIIIAIFVITYLSINTAKNNLDGLIENNLKLEVHNLMKMFEREYALKLEKVKTDLKVAHDYFYTQKFEVGRQELSMPATNQITEYTHEVPVNEWFLDGVLVQNHYGFVDKMQSLFGGTVTIFQKIDSGYLRISTNVPQLDGSRAIGTYIPNNSPVVQSVEQGETYFGRAYVVNDWYITAYEPIYNNGKIIGALYVGGKEKDLQQLREIVMGTDIGLSGFPYVFDEEAVLIIHPVSEGQNWMHLDFMQKIISMKRGTLRYFSPTTENDRLTAFDYFEDFHFYVAATIDPVIEARDLINRIILNTAIVGLIIIAALSLFVYFITSEGIHRFLNALEASNRQLSSAQEALRRSEKLAELGQLSSGIVKEISNPLNRISQKARSMKQDFDTDSVVFSDLDLIDKEAEKGKSILSGILNFSQGTKLTLKETNINEMVEIACQETEFPSNIKLEFIKDENNPIAFLDTGKMIQAVKNIIRNGIESMEKGGTLSITVLSGNRKWAISIADEGKGFTDEEMKMLFDPFRQMNSGKESGTGLGLAVTYGIVKMHHGEIEVRQQQDKNGTMVTLSFPRN